MASLHIFYLLCLVSVITFTSSSSSPTPTPHTITIPISPLFTKHPSSDPFHTLKLVSSASVTRAHHLKQHHKKKPSFTNSPPQLQIKTPIHPKSYGGYSIDLKFGTPPQTFPFVFDTGSSLVWLPCSSHYLCSKCNSFPNITKTPKFIPKDSTSSKFIGCKNPKCAWVFGPNVVQSRCSQECKTKNCSQICPAYTIQYGMGSTAGFLLSENLNFPGKIVPDFLVGCSVVSIYQPAGIAGFGRGPESVPSQMKLKRFSFCLVSHRFDDSPENSDLVLYNSSGDGNGLSYTKFQKNPSSENSALRTYYYVTLRKIIVGGKSVRVPRRFFEPDSKGNGGSIVDSGSTFTFMERPIYDLVAQEFEKQVVNYTRVRDAEKRSGLSPCFNVSSSLGIEAASFPSLAFQFRGGAKMALPLTNYFSFVEESDVACLTIVSDDVAGPGVAGGPAVIFGNYQQQNFYVEYDLENERFGFRSQSCKKSVV